MDLPELASLTPTSGKAGEKTALSLSGKFPGGAGDAKVYFSNQIGGTQNVSALDFTAVSETLIKCVAPATLPAGKYDVFVQGPGGISSRCDKGTFVVTP